MRKEILAGLNLEINERIEKLLPDLKKNPTAINLHIINALQSLREVFALQEPVCQEFACFSAKSPANKSHMQSAEGIFLTIWLAELMAVRLNCPTGSLIDDQLYELRLFNGHL